MSFSFTFILVVLFTSLRKEEKWIDKLLKFVCPDLNPDFQTEDRNFVGSALKESIAIFEACNLNFQGNYQSRRSTVEANLIHMWHIISDLNENESIELSGCFNNQLHNNTSNGLQNICWNTFSQVAMVATLKLQITVLRELLLSTSLTCTVQTVTCY